jgi:TonB-linked SusC/RagA family outer membrane protein
MRYPPFGAAVAALCVSLSALTSVHAQSPGRIAGAVTDERGTPLPAVRVNVAGTTLGAATGSDGRYTINGVPPGDRIVRASRLGYGPRSQPVSVVEGQIATANFVLTAQAVLVEGMVVVGYGTQKATSLTGSIASVDAKDLESRSVANPIQALQGKMSGLRVTQTSGQPGREGVGLGIRGQGSFSGDRSPLVIIDDVVGSLSDLDPNTIESVSVLKDASSASIYGARAANGVIVVTTKRGARVDGLRMNYSGKMMRQSVINLPDLVWNSPEWMQMHNTAIANARLGIPLYPDSIINLYRTPSALYPSVDWAKEVFRSPSVQSHNMSFTGKSGATNYYASLGRWDQDGIIKGFYYKKNTGLLNLDSRVNDRVKFGMSLKALRDEWKQPYNGAGDVLISLSRSRPTYGPLLPDGSGRYTSRAWPTIEVPRGEKNLFGLAEMGGEWSSLTSVVGNASTEVTLLPNLRWTTRASAQFDNTKGKYQRPLIPTYNWFTGAFDMYADQLAEIVLRQNINTYNYYTAYSTLNVDRSFGGVHNVSALAGASVERLARDGLTGERRGFASPVLDVLNAGPADGQVTTGFLNEYGLASTFGRVNYNYREKYLVEGTIRRDGSSRFPPANKYGVFPAVSAGWRISEERFFPKDKLSIDELKVRASYGRLGKDSTAGGFSAYYPYQEAIRPGYDYPFGNTVQPGVARTALANDQIRWEETSIADVGIDMSTSERRLSLTADYYVKTTSGILRPSQIPAYAGLTSPVVNQGVVRNIGVELTLGHQNQVRGVDYGATFIFSAYRNKVTKFGAPQISGNTLMQEGLEIDSYFLYQADGIYKSQAEIDQGPKPLFPAVPGDIRLRDVNGDGKITPDDRVDVRGRHPKFEAALDLNASWRSFDVSAFLQGENGRKIMTDSWLVRPFQGGGGVLSWWRDAWSPQNPDSDKPRLVHAESRNTSIWAPNTYWLRDASYIRLRNLSLGYRLPEPVAARLSLSKARIYLNGENLFTRTPFEFGNPEENSTNSYPVFRTLMLGLDVGF